MSSARDVIIELAMRGGEDRAGKMIREVTVNKQVQMEIVVIARSMLDGHVGIVKGCRTIATLRLELSSNEGVYNHEVFTLFRGVDSETDHLPLGESRKHYDENYLQQLDEEMRECTKYYEKDVFDACIQLITFLDTLG